MKGHIVDHNHSGLYRDDGLILLRNTTGPKMDRIRKDAIKTFKDVGFKIDIKTNLKVVDFLDATFNLSNGTYKPYKKPNDTLLYINTSNKEMFDKTKPEHEKALKDSGYDSVELK